MSVGVRVFSLDLRRAALARCAAVLDAHERARADEFAEAAARDKFIAAHGLMRFALAAVAGGAPAALSFVRGPFGKPYLSEGGKPHPLKFSLSHAGCFMALAWSCAGEVGIDIETPRAALSRDLDGLIAHVLSGAERKRLRRLAPAPRAAGFYRLWTRKEALAKASGVGFSLSPAAIPADKARRWRGFRVRDLVLPPGLFGALAA